MICETQTMALTDTRRVVCVDRPFAFDAPDHVAPIETIISNKNVVHRPLHQSQPFFKVLLRLSVADDVEMYRPGRIHDNGLLKDR